MRVAIVAPCHIPPSKAWVAALDREAHENGATVIVVDDGDGVATKGIADCGHFRKAEWLVFDYALQEKFLGDLYPEFARLFHKCSACRVFGHLVALKQGYDAIIGLDSDCIVSKGFVKSHTQFLGEPYGNGWFNPLGNPWYSRGFPYSQRNWPVVANMGLWENVLDINGADRQSNEPKEVKIMGSTVPVAPFPFSGMNFALTAEAIPGFLFLPNFDYPARTKGDKDAKFRRIDDIWGGYIFQKIMRLKHQSSMVGYPFVFHDTVVVPEEDTAEEAAMYLYEDAFLDAVDYSFNQFFDDSWRGSYREAFERFAQVWEYERKQEFEALTPVFDWWIKAIKKYA